MKRVIIALSALSALLPLSSFCQDAAPEAKAPQPGDLEQVQIAEHPALDGVTRLAISPDGSFVYASSYKTGSITTFSRNAESGELAVIDSLTDPRLAGMFAFRLSTDGAYAVTSTSGDGRIKVFTRDAKTGKLKMMTTARGGENGDDGLASAADASFAADNKFIYTASFKGVGVYRLEDGQLSLVQYEQADGKLAAVRNLVVSADGSSIYALGYQSANIAVLRRDQTEGKVQLVQLLGASDEGCDGIKGAFRVCGSPDGRHVYVNSGRFGGAQGVSVFAVQPDGTLKPVEQHLEGGTLEGFKGGNDIKVSPDGRLVYAVACLSDQLFRFQRDAESGALIPIGSQSVGRMTAPGAAGLCFSPDGKFVYVADEDSASVVVLKAP
jgi:6-phosphogluconolactonase (cycloisomerase 2 family)